MCEYTSAAVGLFVGCVEFEVEVAESSDWKSSGRSRMILFNAPTPEPERAVRSRDWCDSNVSAYLLRQLLFRLAMIGLQV
jgi:hypothetical protein